MIYILLGVIILLVLLVLFLVKVLGVSQEEEVFPYREKKYFFSKSEQEFFKVLVEQIDSSKYLIFPKVRLSDFMEVSIQGGKYRSWFNRIKSKHIDFLIWDLKENKIVLAIELDGRSHSSDKMIKRDKFVDELYEKTGLRLERVGVGEDFTKKTEKLISNL